MKQVIDIDKGTVLELRVRPDEGTDAEDTAGHAAGVGPGYQSSPGTQTASHRQVSLVVPAKLLQPLLVVIDPHPGPPVEATVQDVQGFMMNLIKKEKGYGYDSGGGGDYWAGIATGIAIMIIFA